MREQQVRPHGSHPLISKQLSELDGIPVFAATKFVAALLM
jgi:hypothetical protein